ncbi:MAG TPA: ATP-binding protein [Thermoanaerobaculia bacterium]
MKRSGSLVARLTWWFAISLLALYGVPAVLVYFYASAQARQYAVLTLKTEAEALASYVAETGAFDAPELREMEETPIPTWMRVTRAGRILAMTPGSPPVASLPDPDRAGLVVDVVFLPTKPPYVLVRHQVGGGEKGTYVEAIGSMQPLLYAQRRLGAGLLLVGLVIIPLAALGGRALAQRALRPIGGLVSAIGGLDPNRLDQRRPLPESGVEEVDVLSRAFNALLDRLDEGVERMRRFTADASHEIRNPLSVLRTGLEIALRRERSPREYQELLRENLQEIDRLHAVVEGILLLTRDTPGNELRLARDPVDLGELAGSTAASLAAYAAEQGVRIETVAESGLVVSGDAGLLRLVVFNLLDNALKHSPPGETVRLETYRNNGAATLVVSDHGPGVRPEDRERLFERFYRGGPAAGTGVGGIGLSVVRWVAEAHGGSTRLLETEKGAAFEVVLPAGSELT